MNRLAMRCMLARQVEALQVIRDQIGRHREDDLAIRLPLSAVQHGNHLSIPIENWAPRRAGRPVRVHLHHGRKRLAHRPHGQRRLGDRLAALRLHGQIEPERIAEDRDRIAALETPATRGVPPLISTRNTPISASGELPINSARQNCVLPEKITPRRRGVFVPSSPARMCLFVTIVPIESTEKAVPLKRSPSVYSTSTIATAS